MGGVDNPSITKGVREYRDTSGASAPLIIFVLNCLSVSGARFLFFHLLEIHQYQVLLALAIGVQQDNIRQRQI